MTVQTFSEWITDHARGTLNDEITAALAEVVQAVGDLDRKGKVTIDITVEPAGSGRRTVVVHGRATAKPPVADGEQSIFYHDESGGLHRDDPYQQRADFDDAPSSTDPGESQE